MDNIEHKKIRLMYNGMPVIQIDKTRTSLICRQVNGDNMLIILDEPLPMINACALKKQCD